MRHKRRMKTTLTIADRVMAQLKREAARQGRTTSGIVENLCEWRAKFVAALLWTAPATLPMMFAVVIYRRGSDR